MDSASKELATLGLHQLAAGLVNIGMGKDAFSMGAKNTYKKTIDFVKFLIRDQAPIANGEKMDQYVQDFFSGDRESIALIANKLRSLQPQHSVQFETILNEISKGLCIYFQSYDKELIPTERAYLDRFFSVRSLPIKKRIPAFKQRKMKFQKRYY